MPTGFNLKRQGLLFFAVVCVVFLFFGGPDLIPARSFKHAWDLGHIAAFAAWTLLLMRTWPWLAAAPFGRQAMVAVLFCLVAGGSVEILQGLTGRYPAWEDMGRNAIGCLLVLFFVFPKRLSLARTPTPNRFAWSAKSTTAATTFPGTAMKTDSTGPWS